MCAKNKNMYAWSKQAIKIEIATHDLYCCLLPPCEALHTCHSGFPITSKWCCDQDVKVMPSSAFTQRTCDRGGCCKKEGMLLQPLRWCCVDCMIHHKRDVHKEQKYVCVKRASNSKRDCNTWSLLWLAAMVRSFAHMPLGISDRITIQFCNSTECMFALE